MTPFEKITANEKDMITAYINEYTKRGMRADLLHILRYWHREKATLFNLFGGELILEKEIEYSRSKNQMKKDLDGNAKFWELYNELRTAIHAHTEGGWWIEPVSNWDQLYYSLSFDELLDNTYMGETMEINDIKFVKGETKFMRAIGKLNLMPADRFEELRIILSQATNQKKLKGTLCLSIHPLDYMTMSDNDCGWHSCMSWQNEGEYRLGTIEMLNSPVVVVGYLKSSEGMSMPGSSTFSWNSKKWRELFIYTPDKGIYGVKGYPYQSEDLETACVEWLNSLRDEPYSAPAVKYTLDDLSPKVYLSTGYMYNDIGCRDWHLAIIPEHEGRYSICYSGQATCMSCGEEIHNVDEADRLECENCDPCCCCAECGETLYPDDTYYGLNDEPLCEYCFNKLYATSDITGETIYRDEAVFLHKTDGSGYFIVEDGDLEWNGEGYTLRVMKYDPVSRSYKTVRLYFDEDYCFSGIADNAEYLSNYDMVKTYFRV